MWAGGLVVASLVACVLGAVVKQQAPDDNTKTLKLWMPNVSPQVNDTYLCYAMEIKDDHLFMVGYEPHAEMSTAHHMLMYGCEEPGNTDKPWNCGEMATKDSHIKSAPVCRSGPGLAYAWGMNAPSLTLPPGVGFEVGQKTKAKWLVVQVHYKNVTPFKPPSQKTDQSGVTITATTTPQPKHAGVFLLGTGGMLPPHSQVKMEVACSYNEPVVMHPFAFRVHAHVHGVVNSGYRVRDGKWTEIGRMSPRKEQMFYNVTNPGMTIESGDMLAARCTMKNDEDRTVYIGATQNDEMCNFYIMYWVAEGQEVQKQQCWSQGPPNSDWSNTDGLDLEGMPKSVSLVPGEIEQEVDGAIKNAESEMNEMSAGMEKLLSMFEQRQEMDDMFDERREMERREDPGFMLPEYMNSLYADDDAEAMARMYGKENY